jgi:cephalosporin hydroxylase
MPIKPAVSRRLPLVILGALLLGGVSACGEGGSEPPKTREIPPPAGDLPLPEGWTRQQFIDRFIQLWSKTPKGLFANRWMGVRTEQNPFDVWVTQEILYEVKPDFVVEAGSMHGGSSILWSMILQEIHPEGRVITIDIKDRRPDRARLHMAARHVEFMLGSSTDPAIVAEVEERVRGKKVLVILDSDHSKKHVLDELRAYAPLVDVDSYVIVQDGVINGHPLMWPMEPGPYEAVEEFMIDNDEFVIDLSRERLLVTNNPHGYLKRVKPPS